MKKYGMLISIALMVFATCAYATAPALFPPGLKLIPGGNLTPGFGIDLDNYALDRDAAGYTITGPVALDTTPTMSVSLTADNVVYATDTAVSSVGYIETYQFTITKDAAADVENLVITIVDASEGNHLDPDPLIGYDFDNDSEGWTGTQAGWWDAATYGYDGTEKAFTIAQAGNSGDKYVSLAQDFSPPSTSPIMVEKGKLYEITVNLKGSNAASDMPKVRFLAGGALFESTTEFIINAMKDVGPGTAGRTYTAKFIPQWGASTPTDKMFVRVDSINLTNVVGAGIFPIGPRTLTIQDFTVNQLGDVPATATLTLIDSWSFDSGVEGWSTFSVRPRNWSTGGGAQWPAGTASFAAASGAFTCTTNVTTSQGILGLMQSPSMASDTIEPNSDYLVVMKLSGSDVSGLMPSVRLLMASTDANYSSEFVMPYGKNVLPDSSGSKTFMFMAKQLTNVNGAFVRVDAIRVGTQVAGSKDVILEDVAIYKLP